MIIFKMRREPYTEQLCSAAFLTCKQLLPFGQLVEDHMVNVPYTAHLCSPLSLTSEVTLRLGHKIGDQMEKETYTADLSSPLLRNLKQTLPLIKLKRDHMLANLIQQTHVHHCCSLRSKPCDSVSWSKITWHGKLKHQTYLNLFWSLRR